MDTLDGLKTVVAVAQLESFTAAAEKLGLSKSLVSKYVGEVEAQLGIRLFNRNSRGISLTDAGSQYCQHARQLIENYSVMIDEVIQHQTSPRGLLRISSPIAFGEHVLARLIPAFSARYPDIKVDLVLNNTAVNMLKDNIDVRIKSGRVDDCDMIARLLCDWPFVVCAAPAYLEKNGRPQAPAELSQHQCVLDSNFKSGQNWAFTDENGQQQTVSVPSSLLTNNPQALVNIVKAGGGIGIVARGSVSEELNSGCLVELLQDYASLTLDIFMIYPHRQHIPRKLQCFIDFMLEALR